jgi:hypothetical protein
MVWVGTVRAGFFCVFELGDAIEEVAVRKKR